MTKEEAIERIKDHMEVHQSLEPRAIYITEALKMAIKTLEQESVLDKIRAEIEQKIVKRHGLNHTRSERDRNDAFLEALDIIDKYKTESER